MQDIEGGEVASPPALQWRLRAASAIPIAAMVLLQMALRHA